MEVHNHNSGTMVEQTYNWDTEVSVGVEEYPSVPVTMDLQAPVGMTGFLQNTPDPMFSIDVLGNIPRKVWDHGTTGFIEGTTVRPTNCVSLPLEPITKDVGVPGMYGDAPNMTGDDLGIDAQVGMMHGQPEGIASSVLHPQHLSVLQPPAPYDAQFRNWIVPPSY